MGDFDFNEKFPISEYINGVLQKKKIENEMEQTRRENVLQTLGTIGSTVKDFTNKREQTAQALSRAAILAETQPELRKAFGDKEVSSISQFMPPPTGQEGPTNKITKPVNLYDTQNGREKIVSSLADAVKGVSGDQFLKYLKPDTVSNTLVPFNAETGEYGPPITKVEPKGSKTTVTPYGKKPSGGKNGGNKGLQDSGSTPGGKTVVFNPNTGEKTVDGKPYAGPVLPKTTGTEEQRRQALVDGAKQNINDIRTILSTSPSVLNELKGIRLTPGKVYSQLASPEAKRLYANLRTAISNDLYLKTGATANETELENSAITYLASLNDSPQDFNMRMDLLDRSISPFDVRAGSRGGNTQNGGGSSFDPDAY